MKESTRTKLERIVGAVILLLALGVALNQFLRPQQVKPSTVGVSGGPEDGAETLPLGRICSAVVEACVWTDLGEVPEETLRDR